MEPFEWAIDPELEDEIFLGDLWGTRNCATSSSSLAWSFVLFPLALIRRRE